MNRTHRLTAAVVVLAGLATSPVLAQSTVAPMTDPKVDLNTLSQGWRASKIIGASVTNEAGDTIGKVDDLIVTSDDRILYMVVSVGGFLGIGDKLVVVPYTTLKTADRKLLLPGATKDSLKALPGYSYPTSVTK